MNHTPADSSRLRSLDWVLSSALAVAGGYAWSACFTADSRPALAWIALTPLIFLIDRERPLFFAWLFGFAAWLPSIHWIATTLEVFGQIPSALAIFLWAGMCAVFALEALVFVAVARWAQRLGLCHRLWILPATWVLLEAQRGFMVQGFPWNLAAYAWVDHPGALPLASWIGATGISFLIVVVNVAVCQSVQQRRPMIAAASWLGVGLALILAYRFAPPAEDPNRRSHPVRIVQPNSPISFDQPTLMANYERLVRLSREACDTPALLIWPESAAWPFSWDEAPRLRRDVEALNRLGCAVVLNSPRHRDDITYNSALLISPPELGSAYQRSTPRLTEYSKRRLVPWGEYVPLADWLPFIQQLARNAGQFTPGTEIGLMPWHDERLAMAICYEVIFPSLLAEQTRAGATILMTVTNDAWYGDTAAPWQHLRAARFRAAENRRPMLRAALTGVSAIIDARGQVLDQLRVGEEGILEARISGAQGLSPFSKFPWWPVALSGILLGFAMIRGLRSP